MTYKNLDGTTPDKGFGDVLKWQIVDRLAGRRQRLDDGFVTPCVPNDGRALRAEGAHATWIGHATYAFRLGGKLIVTDPIWSKRVGGTARLVPPGVAFEALPSPDVVTVSHSHYDHLDLPTLTRFPKSTLFVVPKDVGEILRGAGLPNVVELGWWERRDVEGVGITLVPAQHWSMRVPWDRNKRLWGGFVYESSEGTAYHAGDTGFSEQVFSEIAKRFGGDGRRRIDWAMLPIGAYDPPWFMAPQHMGPEEAVRAFRLLGARELLAMHWGTFKLTDEPIGEPPARLRTAWETEALAPDRLHVPSVGETLPLRV